MNQCLSQLLRRGRWLSLGFTLCLGLGCMPYRHGFTQEQEVLGEYFGKLTLAQRNGVNPFDGFGKGLSQEKTALPTISALRRAWKKERDVYQRAAGFPD